MRYLLLALIVVAGCSQKATVGELTTKFDDWRAGLSAKQIADIEAAKSEAEAKFQALLREAGDRPQPGSVESHGALRLAFIQNEMVRRTTESGLPSTIEWYKSQLHGKTIQSLAEDYRAKKPIH